MSKDFDPLDDSIALFREILKVITRKFDAQAWASIQINLAVTLNRRGSRRQGTEDLVEAVALYRGSLSVYDRTEDPFHWADTQNNLGWTLESLGKRTGKVEPLNEAIAAHRAAMQVYSRDDHPEDWASTMRQLADALTTRARLTRSCPDARSAGALIAEARSVPATTARAKRDGDDTSDEAARLIHELCK